MSWVREVKVMQVIRIESVIGNGVQGDPMRPFIEFFDMDGNKLAARDFAKTGNEKEPNQ